MFWHAFTVQHYRNCFFSSHFVTSQFDLFEFRLLKYASHLMEIHLVKKHLTESFLFSEIFQCKMTIINWCNFVWLWRRWRGWPVTCCYQQSIKLLIIHSNEQKGKQSVGMPTKHQSVTVTSQPTIFWSIRQFCVCVCVPSSWFCYFITMRKFVNILEMPAVDCHSIRMGKCQATARHKMEKFTWEAIINIIPYNVPLTNDNW